MKAEHDIKIIEEYLLDLFLHKTKTESFDYLKSLYIHYLDAKIEKEKLLMVISKKNYEGVASGDGHILGFNEKEINENIAQRKKKEKSVKKSDSIGLEEHLINSINNLIETDHKHLIFNDAKMSDYMKGRHSGFELIIEILKDQKNE